MKITFLGVSGALSAKYNSNMLIETDKTCMLFDCGEDIMHSLKAAGRTPEEITDVYISHLHYDHCGGLSWLGYYSYFVMRKGITLFVHESMVSDLWAMLRPAMEKLDGQEMMTLDDYFNVITFRDNEPRVVGSFSFTPVRQTHVETPCGNMYSYGIVGYNSLLEGKYYRAIQNDDKVFFISSDSKNMDIPPTDDFTESNFDYDYIFCDCDVMNLSGVHPNYDALKSLDSYIKSKMWLYHYTDLGDKMPDAIEDGFAGFIREGQIFVV